MLPCEVYRFGLPTEVLEMKKQKFGCLNLSMGRSSTVVNSAHVQYRL